VRDGTLGAAPPGLVGPGTDPLGQPADHLITPELGEQRGASLFHSFSEFGIPAARTATFTGPDPVSGPQSVHQVIGRVTGGSRSAIDGTLRSTIPGADLYLLNPAGVVFGPDASLDLGGSFHATAADHLRLGADGRFSAAAPASDVLSLAPPEAFGFLGSGAGSVEVDGAFLRVPTGETLSLSGGAVSVRSGIVFAPSGRLELAAVDSAGELVPSADDLDASSFETLGLVDVFGATDRSVASVRGGGALFVRGETVVVENAELNLDALSDSDGGGADILARGELRLLDDGRLLGTSDAGGRGGAVRIRAGNVTLRGGSQIRTDASSSGAGGDIAVEATGELLVAGGSGDLSGLFAATGAAATGRGGSIRVRAGTLTLEEGGRIQPFSVGAGDLELEVGSATIR
jgi:filamentous hemagglutinin family protein